MRNLAHIGRNIQIIRELRGMKQEALASEVGLSRQMISKLEQSEEIDEETLKKLATALGVEADAIKNLNVDKVFNNINNFHDQSVQNLFNPIDKVVELYERMLKEKDQTIEALRKELKP
ncbi:helix-turn-helix transcriptional regulator [Pedobacter sp. UBA4863]|uniref:helix-turn-helix domain-containing protein n=1 Tax=Pedobacter sp. UBA4863 TaxID=1947060 RepID=UPI0025CF44E4|nr:helix-turn-helix transcriptional regulator [Pedobacter sp. UBA4863]